MGPHSQRLLNPRNRLPLSSSLSLSLSLSLILFPSSVAVSRRGADGEVSWGGRRSSQGAAAGEAVPPPGGARRRRSGGGGRQVVAEPCAMALRAPAAGKFEGLTSYMREKHWDLQEKVLEFFNSRPDLQTPVEISMAEHRELCMRQLRALVQEANIRPFRLMLEDPGKYFAVTRAIGSVDMSLGIKMGVQYSLWGGSVINLGTQKHRDRFLDGIDNLDYPGCFAMTELHHGSNVQGLQTTATFDPAADEFVIDTPNDGAIKWWIGNAALHGKFATVFARLLLPSSPTWASTPSSSPSGTWRHTGPPRGGNPRLRPQGGAQRRGQRSSQVLRREDPPRQPAQPLRRRLQRRQVLQLPPHRWQALRRYPGGACGGRVGLAYSSVNVLKLGATIAVRYSLLRQQFGPPNQPEVCILDYQSQQQKLMPMVASAYAFHFATLFMVDRYSEMKKTHDEEIVADVHALSAGLKSYITSYTAKSLSVCREACGGHGYAAVNRFGSLRNDHDIFQTFEGDNTVLLQQVAGDLLKQYQEKFKGTALAVTWNYLRDSMATYLSQPNPITSRWEGEDHLRNPKFQLDAFRYRTSPALLRLEDLGSFGAWNRCLDPRRDIESVILEKFIEALPEPENPGGVKLVCDLYALDRIWNDIGTTGTLTTSPPTRPRYTPTALSLSLSAIQKLRDYLCFQVRGVAGQLINAFGITPEATRAPIAMQSEAYSSYTRQVGFQEYIPAAGAAGLFDSD
ncbi:unnamed protein product [Spirodela intermedia]|uniref:Acyl-coenzyme A oxidase n=1 Tax=Spirodela intermedia TaxID=51605 RepID=A0A7I8J4W5_SPIIN|nr:unnamed protein product [Spirodela intermedia]CAA6664421.1 unnamed protein product [Spirodela intermedia]